ncbi:MAG: hypothetical protein NTV49_12675 [Kiritimatiellaeota bacterium]|nr:hypothetical protein [Kiritimatiellota bacterium]
MLLRRRRRLIATRPLLVTATATHTRRRTLLVIPLAFHRWTADVAALTLLIAATPTPHTWRRPLTIASLVARRRALEVTARALRLATATHPRRRAFSIGTERWRATELAASFALTTWRRRTITLYAVGVIRTAVTAGHEWRRGALVGTISIAVRRATELAA